MIKRCKGMTMNKYMSNKTKSLILLSVLLLSIIILTNVNALPSSEHIITPDGKYIYVDDDKAYLKATYSVTHGQSIEHSAMTKSYTGDCDFAIGFDGEVAWPKKVLLDDPHYVYSETETTRTFYHVSNLEETTETPDYGNEYNSKGYKFDHKVFTGDNVPGEPEWIDVYGTVVYFDSQENDGTNYTVTWDTIHSQFKQYRDISDKILSNPIEHEFDGKNLWYVTKDIYMTAGEMRNIVIEMDSKINFGENSYKYDIIWKPSHQTISEANAAGNLYVLDPYLNTSWSNRISNQLPDGTRPYLYSLNISNDVGTNNATHIFGNGNFNSDYSDIIVAFNDGTIIKHAIENNSLDPTVLWANVTTNGVVYIYYNNSEAVDTSNFSEMVSGGVVSGSGGKIIHTFLSSGTFSPFTSFDVEYLVVAGGGAGAGSITGYTGARAGGGGGAGGFLTDTGHAVTAQAYSITVGAGGIGTHGGTADDFTGDNSVFDTITSLGGGRGGYAGGWGGDGGSGGGAGRNSVVEGLGTAGQGNNGGEGAINTGTNAGAGGGGGKGATGQTGTTSYGGDGGDGIQSSITGTAVYYGGGGGGARYTGNSGTGGLGGGADGRGGAGDGFPGTANTGGGGGGAVTRYEGDKDGGDGGSGIVIISYNERGTWSTWSETQYVVDSLHYNTSSPYNHTIESDSTLTANRSIVASDDINDTAKSTDTSYLTINVFDNDASIVRNFTFTGDNLDWYQVANISGSYDLKNSGGIIETQSNGNFTTNLAAGTYWIEEAVSEYTPPDPSSLAGTTGNFWVNHTYAAGSKDNYLISGTAVSGILGFNYTGTTWQSDDAIKSGLSSGGYYLVPSIFEMDDTRYLIFGHSDFDFIGFNWTGSTWQSDTAIASGLVKESYSSPEVFQIDDTWYLITGNLGGGFIGYNWTGSTWQSDTAIVSGLIDDGAFSSITVFEMDSTIYGIGAHNDVAPHGYNWTGSAWQNDTSIASGITTQSSPRGVSFIIDDVRFYISGMGTGGFVGFNWTGSAWQSDTNIVSNLGSTGTYSAPAVFEITDVTNVTDSFNVSVNEVWYNTTTDFHFNDTYSAHEWQNITVWAYNSSGAGTLSVGSVSDNKQIPNNVPVLSGVSASYNLYENEVFTIDADHTDADTDTITYSDNSSEWDINSATGEVSWVLDWEDVGIYSYRITIDDSHGGTDYQDFTVTVNGAQNTALTSVDTSFENGNPGTNFADNTIILSFYLINSGSIDTDISAKFTTNYESTYGLVSGTSTIGGSNFKLGNATLDALLDNGNSVDLTDDVPGEVTRRNYEVQLRVPAGQSALSYSGTVELTFSDVV